jgi:enterochelin esterase-like enzyme
MVSKILTQTVQYTILLPANYSTSGKHYKVIYLLHGVGGNEESWLTNCNLRNTVDSLADDGSIEENIYVMPDAGNSYYLNNFDSSYMYMDFFMQEFLPGIDSLFPTAKTPRLRTLLGLSMGGFGAVMLAVKNPESFGHVVCLSAALRTESQFISLPRKTYDEYFGLAFGPGLSGHQRITEHWKANSVYALTDSSLAELLCKIKWQVECGLSDPLLPASEAFHQLLVEYEVPHVYHKRTGSHNWDFWCSSAKDALIRLENEIDKGNYK